MVNREQQCSNHFPTYNFLLLGWPKENTEACAETVIAFCRRQSVNTKNSFQRSHCSSYLYSFFLNFHHLKSWLFRIFRREPNVISWKLVISYKRVRYLHIEKRRISSQRIFVYFSTFLLYPFLQCSNQETVHLHGGTRASILLIII